MVFCLRHGCLCFSYIRWILLKFQAEDAGHALIRSHQFNVDVTEGNPLHTKWWDKMEHTTNDRLKRVATSD